MRPDPRPDRRRTTARFVPGLMALAAAALLGWGATVLGTASAAEEVREIAPPAIDEAAGPGGVEVAVLAGGCFWGVQGVFQHVEGVTSAVSGYAGGDGNTADYDKVSRGWTGHAESVRITFDPRKVSYGRILQIYFSVAHDPTQLNRQGPDTGTQYRSAIFPTSAEQGRIASAYIAQLDRSGAFGRRIATRIEPRHPFFPAEDYHQDYLTLHPTQPYIAINDLPKVEALRRLFPALYRGEPVLVASAGE